MFFFFSCFFFLVQVFGTHGEHMTRVTYDVWVGVGQGGGVVGTGQEGTGQHRAGTGHEQGKGRAGQGRARVLVLFLPLAPPLVGGSACFTLSFFGKVLLSALHLLAGTVSFLSFLEAAFLFLVFFGGAALGPRRLVHRFVCFFHFIYMFVVFSCHLLFVFAVLLSILFICLSFSFCFFILFIFWLFIFLFNFHSVCILFAFFISFLFILSLLLCFCFFSFSFHFLFFSEEKEWEWEARAMHLPEKSRSRVIQEAVYNSLKTARTSWCMSHRLELHNKQSSSQGRQSNPKVDACFAMAVHARKQHYNKRVSHMLHGVLGQRRSVGGAVQGHERQSVHCKIAFGEDVETHRMCAEVVDACRTVLATVLRVISFKGEEARASFCRNLRLRTFRRERPLSELSAQCLCIVFCALESPKVCPKEAIGSAAGVGTCLIGGEATDLVAEAWEASKEERRKERKKGKEEESKEESERKKKRRNKERHKKM